MNQFRIKYFTGRRSEAGAALLIIIIGMVVLATLGIAMYTMTYTANMNQIIAQKAAKAYYLSESGIRIAASEYRAAANKKDRLVALHGKTFTMPDNSTVTTEVFPYWFYLPATSSSISIAANTPTQITLYLPGGIPPIDDTSTTQITFPASSLIKYKNGTRATVSAVTQPQQPPPDAFNAANGGTPVTFTISTTISNTISPGDEFYIGNTYSSPQQPQGPSLGGELILNIDSSDTNDYTARIFPPQKGTIFVVIPGKISLYSYDFRVITSSPHTVKFTNIQPLDNPTWPLTVGGGREIYVGKSVGFRSTSNYGQ